MLKTWVPLSHRDPNSYKPQNKVPKVNPCFCLSKIIVPPSIKPCCHVSAEYQNKVHQKSGSRSGQSVKLIQNETTNLKTRLFRLDKEKQKEKFQPVPMSWPCLPVKHSSPLSHSSPNKFSRVTGCYHHYAAPNREPCDSVLFRHAYGGWSGTRPIW
jgi:hypothetical protein